MLVEIWNEFVEYLSVFSWTDWLIAAGGSLLILFGLILWGMVITDKDSEWY